MSVQIERITEKTKWQQLWSDMPDPHILQSWEWGEIKQSTADWHPRRYAFYQDERLLAIASIGLRKLGPFCVMYAPRGPLFTHLGPGSPAVLAALQALAHQHRAIWLKIDPDIACAARPVQGNEWNDREAGQQFKSDLIDAGWQHSPQQVQFPNTQRIALSAPEETILAQMSANARRKIRIAQRKGIQIRSGNADDIPEMFQMYAETAQRNDFRIRSFAYYRTAWHEMFKAGRAHFLIATYQNEAIAHCILFHGGNACWFFYGASRDKERNRMPNHLLQWESLRWAKGMGYQYYDFWGAPTQFHESDPLWKVYQYKRGFRGCLIQGLGAWDHAPYPKLYRLYQTVEKIRSG